LPGAGRGGTGEVGKKNEQFATRKKKDCAPTRSPEKKKNGPPRTGKESAAKRKKKGEIQISPRPAPCGRRWLRHKREGGELIKESQISLGKKKGQLSRKKVRPVGRGPLSSKR